VYTPPVRKICDIRYCRKQIFLAQNAQKSDNAPPDPLAAFDGPTSNRGEGRERKGGEGRGEEMLRTPYS